MRSMTGCSRASMEENGYAVTVELRSVNHRFLDVSCRLPRNLSFLEDVIRKRLGAGLRRGHVDVYVTVTGSGDRVPEIRVDEAAAKAWYEAACRLSAVTGCTNTMDAAQLLQKEGVLLQQEETTDETALTELCTRVTDEAVVLMTAMREKEGLNLRQDLKLHLDNVAELRAKVEERAPMVVENYRQRLVNRLKQLETEPVDPARLAQEVALMADRCAIDEELSRLQSHLAQMDQYLDVQGEIGKKMDFLIQEMNRETNTIGSKANDTVITQYVVDMKNEIEKLREQIQNVE